MKNMKLIHSLLLIALCMSLGATKSHAQGFAQANPKDIALYPQQNVCRNVLDISGIWKFKKDVKNTGEAEQWFNGLTDAEQIAVPGSWNDQHEGDHNYLGTAWYELETNVPEAWKNDNIYIRVGSAVYFSKMWINGIAVGQHEGGHLPFAFLISDKIKWGEKNRITIEVENELKPDRIPNGNVQGGSFSNFPASNYDFFPYAGLSRKVFLYSTPKKAAIKDITVQTDFEGSTGKLSVLVEKEGAINKGVLNIKGHGVNKDVPFTFRNHQVEVKTDIPNVELWSPKNPALYEVTVYLGSKKSPLDVYTLETGVRTIKVTSTQVLLNGEPILLKGFGKHEDFPIYGRATTLPVMVKDYSLMKWVGANSYRTSHYPYSEEYYTMADKEGFLIIDETPAVGLVFFDGDEAIQKRHAQAEFALKEVISRDKNHPSVVAWSVANEPSIRDLAATFQGKISEATQKEVSEGRKTLSGLMKKAKEIDPTRITSFASVMGGPYDWLTDCDVIFLNRYYGWYTNVGYFDQARAYLNGELDKIYNQFKKPILLSEFGADAIAGSHGTEDEIFTEEYQKKLINMYLDVANSKEYIVGMHIWNFADFRTAQAIMRVDGMNLKGVFTQNRRPKMAAHLLRERWFGTNKF